MPEAAIAAPATAAPTSSPAMGAGESSHEPTITYGSPEGDQHGIETPETGAEQPELETGADEFGELEDFGDETGEESAEAWTSEQYKELKEALAQKPELFKALKRQISENSRYKELFESPESARDLAEWLESMGGRESVDEEAKEWSTVYNMFASGDPGVIDYWAKDNPEALSKLYPHVYDRMAESDPATWAHKAAQTFIATAQQQEITSSLDVLAALDAVNKSPEAVAQINKIIEALNRIDAVSKQSPSRDLTPEAKKLEERSKALKSQENAIYQRGVSQKVAPLIGKNALNALNAVTKGRKLTGEARKSLLSDINLEYARLAKKDDNFQKNAKALLAAGETDKFVKLVTSNLSRTMPLAARNIWRKYTGISGLSDKESSQRRAEGQSRREVGGGGTTHSVIRGPAPKAADVDWERMRGEFGRDGADEIFAFGKKGVNGGIRFFYKKGDKRNIYTF